MLRCINCKAKTGSGSPTQSRPSSQQFGGVVNRSARPCRRSDYVQGWGEGIATTRLLRLNNLPNAEPEALLSVSIAGPLSDDAQRIAELAREVDRLTAELSYRDRYIVELEVDHAEQMRVRMETEARAAADALVLRNALNAFYSTSSWRLTRPLRVATRIMRRTLERLRPGARAGEVQPDGSRTGLDLTASRASMLIEPDPMVVSVWISLLSTRAAKGS